jgi:hypothetical protein
MENKAKTRTEQILTVITILAWIAFIGFMIEAGAILVSFGVSCISPEAAKDISSAHSGWLSEISGKQFGNEVPRDFIFIAGLVFIISQIFKRGVEIQSENELTV